jgi:hypothetical protein
MLRPAIKLRNLPRFSSEFWRWMSWGQCCLLVVLLLLLL